MLSNNASLSPLPLAPEGNLSFQGSGFVPSSEKVVDANYGESTCLLCLSEAQWQAVDKVTVSLCGAVSKENISTPK